MPPLCTWETLEAQIHACQRCPLGQSRTHAVPGEGNRQSPLLLVGEGPGADEDACGRPFVGKAGQLLDRMLQAIGLSREEVYIANVVKCRPPQNRIPTPAEAQACLPFLREQTRLIRPCIIVCLGATAAQTILGPDIRITRDRGQWHLIKGVQIMATYHPAALLRDPGKKPQAWEDLQSIAAMLSRLQHPNATP